VCCLTAESPDRMAVVLEPLRTLADEIFLAVDDRVHRDADSAYSAIADLVVRASFRGVAERALGWLLRQCSTDWIVRIDGDEVVSDALVDELSALRTDDITHALIARRWVYSDAAHVLDCWPWHPDHVVRAVRNDPSLWQHPGYPHDDLAVVGPYRVLEAPLYHADLLLKDVAARRAKCAEYRTLNPAKVVDGEPINEAFYLPEDRTDLILTEVAGADRSSIARLLDPPALHDRRAADVRRVERAEIDEHWSAKPFAAGDHRADLEITHRVNAMPAGATRTIDVRVQNLGNVVWPWGDRHHSPVHVSYRWERPDGSLAVAEGLRSPLPAAIGPGESTVVPVRVLAPPRSGSYVLALELVHETVRWFGEPVRVTVEAV